MDRLLKNKYKVLKNVIRALFITETLSFILIMGVIVLFVGIVMFRFVSDHLGAGVYQMMDWELLKKILSKEMVVMSAVLGAGLMLVVNRFYLKNLEQYRLIPISPNRIMRSELIHTCSIVTVLICGLLILYGTIADMNRTLMFQLLGYAMTIQFTNLIFPIMIAILLYSKISKMPFFLYIVVCQVLLAGQNALLLIYGYLYFYLAVVFLELVLCGLVVTRIRKNNIIWKQPTVIVENSLKYRIRKNKKKVSLWRVIWLENLSHYKIILQMMLLPTILLFGMKFLGMETNVKISRDYFTFIPAIFGAIYVTYQKQYHELPINEKKNIWIRLTASVILTAANFIFVLIIAGEGLEIRYLIDVIAFSIVLFVCVVKMKIRLMIGYKENPMLYIFLGVAVLTNYFLREMVNLTFYMVLDKPVYVCTSSVFLGVMSLIVLLIQKKE